MSESLQKSRRLLSRKEMNKTSVGPTIIAAGFLFLAPNLMAQIDSLPATFFPAQLGNVWNYGGNSDTTIPTNQIQLTKDSIADGDRYLFFDTLRVPLYKVDSLLNMTYFANGWLQYKLTARKNDVWTAIGDSTGRIAARVDSLGWGQVLGKITQIKAIGYYTQRSDTTNFSGWLYEDYLAAGFGFFLEITDASQTPNVELLGCIIDGVKYGSVTAVDQVSDFAARNGYTLFPAYPSPFNSISTISYVIPRRAQVNISLYNLLGICVGELVDDIQETGNHSVRYHPGNLPSGVYLIRMRTDSFSQTQRLLYLK